MMAIASTMATMTSKMMQEAAGCSASRTTQLQSTLNLVQSTMVVLLVATVTPAGARPQMQEGLGDMVMFLGMSSALVSLPQ